MHRRSPGWFSVPPGVYNRPFLELPSETTSNSKSTARWAAMPGTMILVFVFLLACFVVYYFANWKLLSAMWQIG